MARLDDNGCMAGEWEQRPGEPTEEWIRRTEGTLAELERESRGVDIEAGEVVGLVATFPVADGHAVYRVSKASPLTLQHVPFGDAWRAHPALVRGLHKSDILAGERSARMLSRRIPKCEHGSQAVGQPSVKAPATRNDGARAAAAGPTLLGVMTDREVRDALLRRIEEAGPDDRRRLLVSLDSYGTEKLAIRLVFADWLGKNHRSVYSTEAGVGLSMGQFHSGTTFEGTVRLDPDDRAELEVAFASGYTPVFHLIPSAD